MPMGKELGDFAFQTTSFGYSPGDGGAETVAMNMEGALEGPDGNLTVLGTLTGSPNADATSGTYTWLGRDFAADGTTRVATGGGYFSASGNGTWALRGYVSWSDGSGGAVEGELNLASRSLTDRFWRRRQSL